MPQVSALDAARRFVREHERGLIVAWIAGCLLLVGIAFTWGIAFRGAERVVDAWQQRWPRRVDEGASLVAQRRFEQAAQHLEQLDAQFPARSVVHRFDRERERLLTLLVESYTALDKKKRALAACERLVAFDPRNWENHWTQARTALFFSEDELAEAALDALLAIHPTHLPAVEARIKLCFDAAQFAKVPPLWRAYLDAYRLAPIDFLFDGSTLHLEVPADGRPQRFEVAFALAGRARGEASFVTHGWSLDVRAIAFLEPQRAGVVRANEWHEVVPDNWSALGGSQLEAGCLRADSPAACLRGEIAGPQQGAERAAFELVVYKACSESLWTMVATSYKNLLLWDELESLRARTRVGGCLEAGTLFAD